MFIKYNTWCYITPTHDVIIINGNLNFQKFKSTESKVQEQQTLIDSLREELEKTKVSLFDEKEVQRKLQLALDQAKTETQDLERAERVVRVDLEQSSKKVLLPTWVK